MGWLVELVVKVLLSSEKVVTKEDNAVPFPTVNELLLKVTEKGEHPTASKVLNMPKGTFRTLMGCMI